MCWIGKLSTRDILQNKSEKDARIQHKAILGILQKRTNGYMDVGYHKLNEKANKLKESKWDLRLGWIGEVSCK